MKKFLFYAVIAAFLGAASLSAKGQEVSGYAQGKALYQEKCLMCHGKNGEGDGPLASSFADPPVNFTKPGFWKDDPEQKIKNTVEKGYKLMPPIDLTADQITKVIDYISHTFKK
jgi:mono/diheme cytochrome c family protein